MDLLLDAFGRFIPDSLNSEVIQVADAVICKFNCSATLLATGSILLYDTDTWILKAPLYSHVGQITSLDWSAKGSHLLSASRDWNCTLWDLANYPQRTIVRTDTQVVCARFIRGSKFILVPLVGPLQRVHVTSLDDGSHPNAYLKRHDVALLSFPDPDYDCCQYTAFDILSDHFIVVGSSKGSLTLLDCTNSKVLARVKVGSMLVKGVEISESGVILVNSADRQIRTYKLSKTGNDYAFVLEGKFQDLVEKIAWSHAMFSSNEEYIVGGSADKQKHNIYVWDKSGRLETMLEGPFESLDHFDWHPLKSQIVSLSVIGRLYRWELKHKENWSAFAPGFEELEDNIEYEEREDEFDKRTVQGEERFIESDMDLSAVSIEIEDAFHDHFVFSSHPY